MWSIVIDRQTNSLPGLFSVRLTRTGLFSWFVYSNPLGFTVCIIYCRKKKNSNTLKQINIRLNIENNVASSLGAKIV